MSQLNVDPYHQSIRYLSAVCLKLIIHFNSNFVRRLSFVSYIVNIYIGKDRLNILYNMSDQDELDRKEMLAVVVRKVRIGYRIHPNGVEVFEETEARLKKLFGSDYVFDKDLAEFIYYTCPVFENLQMYSLVMVYSYWAFSLDDFTGRHPEEKEKWIKIIKNKECHGDGYLEKHFQTAIEMSKEPGVISELAFDKIINLTLFWLGNNFDFECFKSGTDLPTDEEYVERRIKDVGAAFFLCFCEIDSGLEILPGGLAEDTNWISLFVAVSKHLFVMNDLDSFRKEIRDRNMKSNYIYIKMKNNNMSAQEAVDSILEEVNQCEQLVDYYGNCLKSWNNKCIDKYVQAVKYAIHGNSYWGSYCDRYNKGLDVKPSN